MAKYQFPCAMCSVITPRFNRYAPHSWAWENALADLVDHIRHYHGSESEEAKDAYIRSVAGIDGPEEKASRPRRVG